MVIARAILVDRGIPSVFGMSLSIEYWHGGTCHTISTIMINITVVTGQSIMVDEEEEYEEEAEQQQLSLGLSPGQLSLAARASGRLLPVLPTEASDLFKALLEPLSKREANLACWLQRPVRPDSFTEVFQVLVACRQLDASLRRLLADTDLLRSGGAEVRPSNIEVRLQILYGLPLHAAALGDMESCKDLARVVEAWVQKLLEAKDAPAYALATAYLAATTASDLDFCLASSTQYSWIEGLG
eukprot:s105_g30.t1